MEESGDDAALMTDFGATKIQSIVRMVLVRSKLLKQINARYEKIYDPKRERFYYYDRVKDESSWGKPALLLKSDIAEISPTYVEGEEGLSQSARLRMTQGVDNAKGGEEVVESDLDESVEKAGEEESSDESSVDSETARERRRLKRKFPRSKAQSRVDEGEDNIVETKALDLSGIGAYRISSRIYDLAELTYLNLSDNHLGRISPNIQYFANLQRLDIHSNQLPTLPKEFEELQQLTFLDASRNFISTFPGRVYKLRSLEHLDLSRNPLKVLPVEVGNLELLQELGQWEVGIGFLSRLQHLDVSRCLLTEWPPQINQLPELTYLNLSRNSIKAIPAELADLQTLHTLLLSHNGIDDLTPDIYSLQQLQILDLSHNALRALPQLPPSNLSSDPQERCLERLVDVDLSHNQLTVLDDMLGVFCRAEKLDASHNEIQSFEGEALGRFTALRVLDLSHNELRVMSPGLRSCTLLQHLRVTHNKLSVVPDYLSRTTKVVTVDLSHNEITDAAGKIFAMLNELRRLDLHHNRIGPLPALLFSLRHLQHLDMSHNQIPDLAEGLGALSGINHLNFSNNQIVSVPDTISNLTLLKSLELENNRITALPSSLSKLYRTLARVTVSRNNFALSPNLLVTLPMLLTCNLSWNPNLKSQFVDWQKLSAEYKPKKAFISPEILSRRIASVVDRLDALIREAKPPALPASFFMSGAQAAAAAGAEPVDDELLEFQNTVQDDNPELAASSAAALKEAKKKRSKGAKRVKQAFAWQDLLRVHLLTFASRADAVEGGIPTTGAFPAPLVPTGALSAQPAPVISDVTEAQKQRLNAHMHSLFKLLDKNRGGTPIGMSWQEALTSTQSDIMGDSQCASILSAMSLGSELQDSIESLQYLINEIDALLMIQELRQLLNNYAKLMGRLRVAEKEEKALAAVSPTVKSRLTALGGVAKKFVKTANAGGNLEDRDLSASSLSRSSKAGRGAPMLPIATREPSWVTGPGPINEDQEGDLDGPSWSAEPFSEGAGDYSADRVSADELDGDGPEPEQAINPAQERQTSEKGQPPVVAEATMGFEASDKTSQHGEESRKEVAEDHLDLLARNIRASVKMRRDNNRILEEAAKLAKSIADTIDQVQKPSLGIVYTRLPHLAFLPAAVEGIFPGLSDQNEALLPVLVDCCLHLCKALLLRADGFRDAIREIELRGGIPVSSLDVSQRRGDDFLDLMEDVHQELSRAIDLRENDSAGDGPKKSKSIFGKKSTASSALLEAAMAGASPAVDSDADDAGEDVEEISGAAGEGGDDSASAAASTPSKPKVTRGSSSATITSEHQKPVVVPVVPLSAILPRIDPDRKPIHPVSTAVARRCIKGLTGHRVLTLMWTSYLLEVVSGILARRGTDPQYQKFRTHTKHSYNYTPEWVTQSTGRVSQMKGRVYQGLCIYHQAIDEFAVCTKFSKNARSRPYYVNIIKLHLAQGNFMWARSVLFDALRELYPRSFPGFDLQDSTAMPDPIDVLRVDKELALLQGLIDVNLAQLNSCGLFTSIYSRFNSVQENGLLSVPDRIPVENVRGLSLHSVAVIKTRNSGEAEVARKAKEALESSREELKLRIQQARDSANESLNTPQ